MTGRIPDVTQVWNFENEVLGAMVSLPTYFRGQGYVTLCSGKVWHWGPGPGTSWSDDLAAMWPESSVSNHHLYTHLFDLTKLPLSSTLLLHPSLSISVFEVHSFMSV
jgi:arylsulfatase A-like enzyme